METALFEIEYASDTPELTDALKAKVEKRLKKLSNGHKDLTGASLAVDTPSGANQRIEYRVRLVVYRRPDNVAAVRTDDSLSRALGNVLDAVERQVREQRERQRARHRRR